MGRPIERMRPAPVTTATLSSSPLSRSPVMVGESDVSPAASRKERSRRGAEPVRECLDAPLLGIAAAGLPEQTGALHHGELPLLAAGGLELHGQGGGVHDHGGGR